MDRDDAARSARLVIAASWQEARNFVSSVVNHRSNAIVELMRAPAAEHDELWLKKALQHAIMLELATLPPYLSGLWSIDDEDEGSDAFRTIHAIVFDEM